MKKLQRQAQILAFFIILVAPAYAQLGIFSKEQRMDLTREWKGDRLPDGRPKVPDSILDMLKTVSAEEAWGVLQSHGYKYQFDRGWHVINPGDRLVGRALTAVFMPVRPDLDAVINDHGKQEGRSGAQNSWPIEMLQPGDVLVVDLFGKIKDGTYAGDNLSTSIFAKSGTGLVVDGAVRDETGISKIKGMRVFVRGADPSSLRDVTLVGINVPIRIGQATVMPGDVVLSDSEGLTFIPPQLAQEVAEVAQKTHMVDEWGHMMLRQGKYKPGEIDGKWTKQMIEEFNQWSEQKGSKVRMQEQ